MILFLLVWIQQALASGSCYEVFKADTFYINSYNQGLLNELERNATFPILEMPPNKDGTHNLWQISRLDNHQRMSVVKKVDDMDRIVHLSIKPLHKDEERAFYSHAGTFYEPMMEYVQLPGKGEFILYISGAVQAKLIEKHHLEPKQVFTYFKSIPRDIFYHEIKSRDEVDTAQILQFAIPMRLGGKVQLLTVALKHDNYSDPDVMDLLTAYFPDSNYRPIPGEVDYNR